MAGYFLLFDGYDLANAVSWIHNGLTGLETLTSRCLLLLGCHTL
jgi:hypothetical protein